MPVLPVLPVPPPVALTRFTVFANHKPACEATPRSAVSHQRSPRCFWLPPEGIPPSWVFLFFFFFRDNTLNRSLVWLRGLAFDKTSYSLKVSVLSVNSTLLLPPRSLHFEGSVSYRAHLWKSLFVICRRQESIGKSCLIRGQSQIRRLCRSTHKCTFLTSVTPVRRGIIGLSEDIRFLSKKRQEIMKHNLPHFLLCLIRLHIRI